MTQKEQLDKKWFKGIIAALIISLVLGVGERLLKAASVDRKLIILEKRVEVLEDVYKEQKDDTKKILEKLNEISEKTANIEGKIDGIN